MFQQRIKIIFTLSVSGVLIDISGNMLIYLFILHIKVKYVSQITLSKISFYINYQKEKESV